MPQIKQVESNESNNHNVINKFRSVDSHLQKNFLKEGKMSPLLAALIALFLLPLSGRATALYVNGATGNNANSCNHAAEPCKTIKAALDKAPAGYHTIRVTKGVYTEDSMTLPGYKFITIKGGYNDNFTQQSEDPAATVIKGIPQSTHEYLFYTSISGSGNEAGLTLQYLTFTQGYSDTIDRAIEFRTYDSARAWLTINHCVFTQFSQIVSKFPKVVYARAGTKGETYVNITDTFFKKNTTEEIIVAEADERGKITANIQKCRIIDNGQNIPKLTPISIVAGDSGITTATIENTLIASNIVQKGHSIYINTDFASSLTLKLVNTTITDNHSSSNKHDNGLHAIASDSSQLHIDCINTLLTDNSTSPAADLLFIQQNSASLAFTATHSILGDKQITGNVQYTSTNEVHGDPKFDSRYHMKKGSPAIDTGICGEWILGPILHYARIAPYDDIDGDRRPGFGKSFGCDIGADEFKKFPWPMFLPAIIHQRHIPFPIPTTPHF